MPQDQTINFEKAFQDLERIVQEFERGGLDLEHGLEKFKHAITLAKICKKRLAQVENKVIKIQQEFRDL